MPDPLPEPPGTPACSGKDPRWWTDGETFRDPAVAYAALKVCHGCPVIEWCASAMRPHMSGDLIVAGRIVRFGRLTTYEALRREWRAERRRMRRRGPSTNDVLIG